MRETEPATPVTPAADDVSPSEAVAAARLDPESPAGKITTAHNAIKAETQRRLGEVIQAAEDGPGDGLDRTLDILRAGGIDDQGERLSTFLVRLGGLVDDGGDVAVITGGSRGRPGLVSNRGRSVDDAALLAWEAGFFPEFLERPSPRDLLALLDEDLRGNHKFAIVDEQDVATAAAYRQFGEELERAGIDLADMTNAQVRDRLQALEAEGHLDARVPEDAEVRTIADLEGRRPRLTRPAA